MAGSVDGSGRREADGRCILGRATIMQGLPDVGGRPEPVPIGLHMYVNVEQVAGRGPALCEGLLRVHLALPTGTCAALWLHTWRRLSHGTVWCYRLRRAWAAVLVDECMSDR